MDDKKHFFFVVLCCERPASRLLFLVTTCGGHSELVFRQLESRQDGVQLGACALGAAFLRREAFGAPSLYVESSPPRGPSYLALRIDRRGVVDVAIITGMLWDRQGSRGPTTPVCAADESGER